MLLCSVLPCPELRYPALPYLALPCSVLLCSAAPPCFFSGGRRCNQRVCRPPARGSVLALLRAAAAAAAAGVLLLRLLLLAVLVPVFVALRALLREEGLLAQLLAPRLPEPFLAQVRFVLRRLGLQGRRLSFLLVLRLLLVPGLDRVQGPLRFVFAEGGFGERRLLFCRLQRGLGLGGLLLVPALPLVLLCFFTARTAGPSGFSASSLAAASWLSHSSGGPGGDGEAGGVAMTLAKTMLV